MQHLSSKQTSPSPAAGLWRIVGCLTPKQTRRFAREIKLLASATFPEQSSVQPRTRAAEGVRVRHSQWCPGRRDAACGCSPRGEAWVYSRKDKGKVRKTFSERRPGVISSLSWRASGGCVLRAAIPLPRLRRCGSRWPRRGRSATARGAATSRARYARSRGTCACTWFRAWARRSWWESPVWTSNGSWAAGWPRG